MFDKRVHDYWDPPDCGASRALIDDLRTATRAENQAAARRLESIGALFELRRGQRGEEEHWAVDTWAAVGAEVAAALRISLGKAGSYITYGFAIRIATERARNREARAARLGVPANSLPNPEADDPPF